MPKTSCSDWSTHKHDKSDKADETKLNQWPTNISIWYHCNSECQEMIRSQ